MNNIDVNKISIIEEEKYTKLLYNDKQLEINTGALKILFGLEKMYDTLIIKLVLDSELETLIEELETHINKLPQFRDNQLKSAIIRKDNYPNMLLVKVPSYKGKVSATVMDAQGYFNIFKLEKKANVKCTLFIDSIWNFKGKNTYKIKLKEMFIL
tara:strand:+ start:12709 stop:13173 length:465 start_codon:yes stop_codon:yes gene_type:complete